MFSLTKVGLGTYRIRDQAAFEITLTALRLGYRHIDTAAVYRNEEEVGRAIRTFLGEADARRSDLVITTKLAPRDHGEAEAYAACLRSLHRLGLDYVDVYLIHWPGKQGLRHDDPRNKDARDGSWTALERLKAEGKVRHIGVSNYTIKHLQQLMARAILRPELLQVELHPLLQQIELRHFCTQNDITLVAYSSLGEGRLVDGSLSLPDVQEIANKHNVGVAIVLLRWAVDKGIAVIPKTTNEDRLRYNLEQTLGMNALSDDDMRVLDILEKNLGPRRFCWDPTQIE